MALWRRSALTAGAAAEAQLLNLVTHTHVVRNTTIDYAASGAGSGPLHLHSAGGPLHLHSIEFNVPERGPAGGVPLVLMPGFGASAGFYFRNFSGLARGRRPVIALDWLGTGLSSRPHLPMCRDRVGPETITAIESFFVDSLEAWRRARGIESMHLLGHSLGGYLATTYALKHADRVQRLILVGPAGLPARPPELPTGNSALAALGRMAWDSGVTPHSVVRAMGPLGPRLVAGYVSQRFGAGSSHGEPLSDAAMDAFERYLWATLALDPSGEGALRHLLAPGAWARSPLLERAGASLRAPLTAIYGEKDWMSSSSGAELVCALTARGIPATISVLEAAGHYAFLDAPRDFNRVVREALVPADAWDTLEEDEDEEEAPIVAFGGGGASMRAAPNAGRLYKMIRSVIKF